VIHLLIPDPDNARVTQLEKQAELELERLNKSGAGAGKPSGRRRSCLHVTVGLVMGAPPIDEAVKEADEKGWIPWEQVEKEMDEYYAKREKAPIVADRKSPKRSV